MTAGHCVCVMVKCNDCVDDNTVGVVVTRESILLFLTLLYKCELTLFDIFSFCIFVKVM